MPAAFLAALSFIEKVGAVRRTERLSEASLLRNTVNQLTADLESKAPPKRQAPMLPLSIIGATELAVSDTSLPTYTRGFAFYKLLKLWTASRTNDLFGLSPDSLRLSEHGLQGTLDRTKRSGPGKRIRFLPIFISRRVFVMNPNWLVDGWAIWQQESMGFQRDYFLPLPRADHSGARRSLADYAHTIALNKEFLSQLRVPMWTGEVWASSSDYLFSLRDTLAFWTEHSERNWLISVLASIGVPREKREFIGRWCAISASDEYLRTAKTMVISLQEQALAGMMRDERWNLQNGGLEDLPEFLIARGVHQCVAASQKDLLQLPRQWHRGPLPPAPEEEVPALRPAIPSSLEQDRECVDSPYFIAIVGKKRLRRLHRRGGCGTDPAELHEVEWVETLQGAVYDYSCKHCWRKEACPTDIHACEASSSSSESSSSNSSSSS